MTVRGLEPELERMARLHQEEISELRRLHQRQMEEAEAGWVRRSAAQKEQEMAEREAAIQHEREAARHRCVRVCVCNILLYIILYII